MAPILRLTALSTVALGLLLAWPASATVIHQVILEYDDDLDPFNGTLEHSSDRIEVPTPADVNRALLATLNGSGHSASGAVGRFGALGLTGFHFSPGRLEASVSISDDAIGNPFSVPMRAVANFIIDGGRFDLIAGSSNPLQPASITWQLDVYSEALGGIFGPSHFQSFLELESNDFLDVTLTAGGADVGAYKPQPNGTAVEMPFSFQTIDLGILPGGGVIDLQYVVSIRTEAEVAEGVFFEFSDPIDVSGGSPFSIEFLPVPEPGALALLLVGAGVLVAAQRKAAWPRPTWTRSQGSSRRGAGNAASSSGVEA